MLTPPSILRAACALLLVLGACSSPAPPPRLSSVAPARVSSILATRISIRGEAFEYAVSADLDHPGQSSFALDLKVRLIGPQTLELPQALRPSTTEIAAVVPAGLLVGRYALEVSTARGSARLAEALEVAACRYDCDLPTDGGCYSWPDLDRDGYGAQGEGAPSCVDDAGIRVGRGGDCRDQDPLANPGAFELCNSLDDDCDGAVDDGTCPPDAGWRVRSDTGTLGEDWTTATNYGRGRVWLAEKQRVFVRPGSGAFIEVSACSNKLLSSWASPSGLAFFGGETVLTTHTVDSIGCGNSQLVPAPVVGLQGFGADAGVYGVLRDGRLIEGKLGSLTERPGFGGGATVNDLQGATPNSLFAVGRAGTIPKIWRLTTDGGAFVDEPVPPALASQLLTAVWAVDDTLAYAVGEQGGLLERTSGVWRQLPSADAGLVAVRAFGKGRVYTATADGRVLRFEGTGWEELYRHPGPATFTDLTGSAEDDLWVVGHDGLVVHWLE